MVEPNEEPLLDRDIWQRFCRLEQDGLELDGAELMALAELAEAGPAAASEPAEAVAALLRLRSELAEDVALARQPVPEIGPEISAIITRACALVPGYPSEHGNDNPDGIHTAWPVARPSTRRPPEQPVLPFRRLRAALGETAGWGALAASFVLIGYLGFALGTETYAHLSQAADEAALPGHELMDPGAGTFGTTVVAFADNVG